MSTFMAFACVDLRSDPAAEQFLAELHRAVGAVPYANSPPGVSSVIEYDGHQRLWLSADYGNIWLGHVIVDAARATGTLRRAVIGLDHDEYGAENVVLDGRADEPYRVHHVYVYPDGSPDSGGSPTLLGVPARAGLPVGDDGTIDGPPSWSAAAELFGVPADRMAEAARTAVKAHESLGTVFAPFEPWWEALGVPYPGADPGPDDDAVR